MDIHKLEILLKTIETGSLTQTAYVMGYSQSAISHTIATLEDELGVQLLVRDRSGVRLTSEGVSLMPYIRHVTASWRELQNKVAEIHDLDYGTIRIGTYTSPAVCWLPGILKSFQDLHPSVKFEVKQGNYAQVANWILRDEIDCGFTISPNMKGLKHILLFEDRLMSICEKNHPLSKFNEVEAEMLTAYPFVMVDEGEEPIMRDFFQDQGIRLNVSYRVVDDYAVMAMVEKGLGISVCPELFYFTMPFNLAHQVIKTDWRRAISISYKDNYTISPVVNRFISHVQAWVEKWKVTDYQAIK